MSDGFVLAAIGCAQTLDAEPREWTEGALLELRRFAAERRTFTAEQFRLEWRMRGRAKPHDHHVWGALFRAAERAGIIQATGQYKRAAAPATRAHPVMIWRATETEDAA